MDIDPNHTRTAAAYALPGIAGGAFGLVVTGVVGALTKGRGTVRPLSSLMLSNAAVCAGVALVGNVVLGGRPGERSIDGTWGQRHQLGFAARHVLDFGVVLDARRAYFDAKQLQESTWGTMNVDDGIDAVRHAYGAAMLTSRLMVDRGFSAEAAQTLAIEIGHMHELDGVDNTNGSARMDEHNNAAGARIGAELAKSGVLPDRTILRDRILTAVADGDLVVLEGGAPRPSVAGDVPPVTP